MLFWWGYAMVVAALLALAALTAERFALARRRPARPVWALALVGSAIWPLLAAAGALPGTPLRGAGLDGLAPPAGLSGTPGLSGPIAGAAGALQAVGRALDNRLPWIWLLASASVLVAGIGSELALRALCRRCRRARVTGVPVWISPATGPAAFGVREPRILMPEWITSAALRERRLALLHELDHLRAGDLRLLWASFLVLCAMPWNPAAWWQYRRLRRAVELDCDARLSGRLANVRQYGELLVRAATMRSARLSLAPALSGRSGLLRRRIEQLGAPLRPANRCSWALVVPFGACLTAALFVPSPPREAPLEEVVVGAARAPVPQDSTLKAVEIRELPAGQDGEPLSRVRATGVHTEGTAARSEDNGETAAGEQGDGTSQQAAGVVRARGTFGPLGPRGIPGAPPDPGAGGTATVVRRPAGGDGGSEPASGPGSTGDAPKPGDPAGGGTGSKPAAGKPGGG